MKFETSYGIIPLSKKEGEWHVLLICHTKGGFWAFPKGHSEKGELPQEAAIRELNEETGLTIKRFLIEDQLKESYHFKREKEFIRKSVYYFLAEVQGTLKLQTSEVWDAKWVKLIEATQYITFAESKNLINQAEQLLIE